MKVVALLKQTTFSLAKYGKDYRSAREEFPKDKRKRENNCHFVTHLDMTLGEEKITFLI